MGRRKVYGADWRQQVVEMPHDVGEVVEAMAASSGLSLDGVIRTAMRIEAAKRGVDLAPWERPLKACERRRSGKVGAPRTAASPWKPRDCRRIAVMICRTWALDVLGSTVTAAAVGAVVALRDAGWDAETLRSEAMRLPPLFADADSAAAVPSLTPEDGRSAVSGGTSPQPA